MSPYGGFPQKRIGPGFISAKAARISHGELLTSDIPARHFFRYKRAQQRPQPYPPTVAGYFLPNHRSLASESDTFPNQPPKGAQGMFLAGFGNPYYHFHPP